jgi:hypothetical protein
MRFVQSAEKKRWSLDILEKEKWYWNYLLCWAAEREREEVGDGN